MIEQFIWYEKYRPTKVADVILPEHLKVTFTGFVEQKALPNLILAGPSGLGKTTVARAVVNEIGATDMVINGSLDGTKDTLRTDIKTFAVNKSMAGGRKYIIIDEADYLSPQMQPALRNFMDEYAKNVGFIFTCNHPYRIIEAVHSRSAVINFNYSNKDKAEIAKQVFERLCWILDQESVEYDKKVLIQVIKKKFPDIRSIINELQTYSNNNKKIDVGILADTDLESITQVVGYIKDKNYPAIRKWVSECDIDDTELYRKLYDIAEKITDPDSLPTLILIIAEYQKNMVANRDINTAAALTEMSINCTFK